jgi:hypothetical protein
MNRLLILVGGEMCNQWLDIISGWLGAQQGEVVAKKIVGLREEVDITSRWGRGNDLQGGFPPGVDSDGHLAVLGEGNACSRSTIGLQEGEDGVKVVTRRNSIGLCQKEAKVFVRKDHGRLGLDHHTVGVAASIGAQGEIGSGIGIQSCPDVVEGWNLDLGSHVEPLGRDLHQNSLAEDEFTIEGKELPVQGGDGGCTNSLVAPEGKAVDPKQSIDE